jgi:single-strand DNA-binding protein
MYTFTGNLAETPETTVSQSGKTVTKGRVICSERYKDSATGEWKSTPGVGWWFEAWESAAQAIEAAQFTKGDAVIIVGEIRDNHWRTEAGENRTRRVISVRSIGRDEIAWYARTNRGTGAVAETEVIDGDAEWSES